MYGRSSTPQLASTGQANNVAYPTVRARQSCRPPVCRAAVEAPERVLEQQIAQPDEKLPPGLNRYSSRVTQPKAQGASQAMLYATGLSEEDMHKPQVRSIPHCTAETAAFETNANKASHECFGLQIGVSSVWYEGNPCNMHLLDLAAEVKAGVEDAGMIGYRFNTIGVSDAISMGTEGMSFSLQSRDIIADSIETVMGGQWYDGNISLPGCDKNMPGTVIAMGRLNRPAIMVYGGTIKPGRSTVDDESLDIVSAFQSYGMHQTNVLASPLMRMRIL